MLVCSVSLLQRRAGIAAAIAEAASAADAPGTGNVVFATLVDDPASVRDTIDAYLGEIMVEAASAAAVVNAGLIYAVAIAEAATAVSAQNGTVPAVITAAMIEPATAASTQDAIVAGVALRSAMIRSAFVNSSGTARQANINGVMVNL